jgi:hypothetical protein
VRRRLTTAAGGIGRDLAIEPVRAVLRSYADARAALREAGGR